MTDAVATFQNDLPALIVGIAVCTIAAFLFAFSLLGRKIADIDLRIAATFAALYGLRLVLRTNSVMMMLGNPDWIHFVHADLDYLVPIPGALLFQRFFGRRLLWLNGVATGAFVLCATIGIPYDIITGKAGALLRINNVVVIFFLAIYMLNIFLPAPAESRDWRILRVATAILGLYILNEHFGFVRDRFGLTSEPIGFLIFIGTIVFTLIQQTVRNQMRVAAVDGELAAARQIQMSILPKTPPAIRGLELSAVYAPASEVAGDFYDFLQIDDKSVGILVADVSGHGVPAALVASMLKVALAGHRDLAKQPARLLQEFNAFFTGKLNRQFITAAYAFIGDGTATIASAGHPPPVIVRDGRTIEEVVADGMILGRFSSARFSERTARFGSGDTLVMYTDGITEAQSSAGEMWGEPRFHRSLSSGTSAQHILDKVRSWSGVLQDDVTLVLARRT